MHLTKAGIQVNQKRAHLPILDKDCWGKGCRSKEDEGAEYGAGVSESDKVRGAAESRTEMMMPLPGDVSVLQLLLVPMLPLLLRQQDFVTVFIVKVSTSVTLSISRLAPPLLPPPHLHLKMMASMSASAAADSNTPVKTLRSSGPASD